MKEHQFTLEPYKGPASRTRCPKCQRKEFSSYIDTATGERLHPTVGRCNREGKCAYHYKPKQYFEDNNILKTPTLPTTHQRRIEKPKAISYIPIELFKASLQAYEVNHFAQYLASLFGTEKASEVLGRYFVATSKHWEGATVFWQIDLKGKIRTGKIMLYSPITGKRVKEPYNHVNWVHKVLNKPNFELEQCLFGEHLLKEPLKPVAIVESEKTAVIASVYIPKFIWLATGGLSNLKPSRFEVLKGRQVFLFPDLNGFDKWNLKAKELSQLTTFTISDLLERKATNADKIEGFDLADYLVRFDYREFKQPQAAAPKQQTEIQQLPEQRLIVRHYNEPKPESWEQEIIELEKYFATVTLPALPIKLNPHSTISDCFKFVQSHLTTIRANNGKPAFKPYLNRLKELKSVLNN